MSHANRITGGRTAEQKFVTGATLGLCIRAGLSAPSDDDPQNHYRGYSLKELARESLRVAPVTHFGERTKMRSSV